ncbi:uncharacterized protein [Hetaerina americana]|uniref:uncharacterized protein n=1 Tax=Hetaerina americana TaxID=62018 RepID=UPI003A7F42E9
MARNYEKNFGQLNRWWLSKNPSNKPVKRPRLADLNSVEEIQKWLPSVKEEINFCLTQSQVPCYTDKKVGEYHKHVLKLEIEYKRMLKKAKSLDSRAVMYDGKVRPYIKKRKEDEEGEGPVSQIILPVLDLPENQPVTSQMTLDDLSSQNNDAPLKFEPSSTSMNVMKQNEKPQLNILGLSYSSSDDDT